MISRHKINDFFWTDLNSPTEAEIEAIAEEYNLEHSITQDLSSPTPKPRVYEGEKFLYAIFHIPAFKHSHREEMQEIDFVIGRNVLLTARYENIDALDKFEKTINAGDQHIFLNMMQEIQQTMFDELFYIEDWISQIESKVFRGLEKEMVLAISEASRNLLNFRKTIEPHKDIYEFMNARGDKFGPSFKKGLRSLSESAKRMEEIARGHSDMLSELRETNNSLLSTKQNEIMKTLTVLAAMTIPASIIASIFNMQVDVPIENSPHGFAIILGIMAGISIAMFGFFRHKKWI